jgi:hypothetical protein
VIGKKGLSKKIITVSFMWKYLVEWSSGRPTRRREAVGVI